MLWEMFLLGLVGSTHCLGMCSGFVLALGRRTRVYQLGRLLGYSLVGAGVASAGWAFRLGLGSRGFMALAGLSMLALGLGMAPLRPGLWGKLLVWFGPLLRRPFFLGLLTAVLPCGLLGAAWMLAATSPSPANGALAMAAFWLGTLPALSMVRFLRPLAERFPRVGYGVVVLIGLSMLWRAARAECWCN